MRDDGSTFEQHRAVLLGLAYRLLGSMHDAEDTIQDAWLRWAAEDRSSVREPRAFLITTVSHLALDRLKSARATREAYVGPWLPEPVESSRLGPLETVELRDTVSYATLHLLERLTPPERAVFVLREAFDLPFEEIADVVGLSAVHCRQLAVRARRRIAAGPDRSTTTREEHLRLLTGFLEAAAGGDLSGLLGLLADDIVAWNDGGGRVRAALRPITGGARVAAFAVGLARRFGLRDARIIDINGYPALRTHMAGGSQVLMIAADAGRIRALYAVLNPDKLRLVDAPARRDSA
ncbi:MAG: RNA polymerase sigma factor SigJ [Blastococcus sp.]